MKRDANCKADPSTNAPPWSHIPPTGPMLRPAEAALYLGISSASFYAFIAAGELPPLVKLTARARASGVPKLWLDAAIAARYRAGT